MLLRRDKMQLDDLTNDEALAVLFSFAQQNACIEVSSIWTKFEEEIKYGNRFFPKTDILGKLDKMREQAKFTINKGEIFYRSRLLHSPFLVKEAADIIAKYCPEMKGKDPKEIHTYQKVYLPMLELSDEFRRDVSSLFKGRKRFWGYNAKDSDAPPVNVPSEGRANPRNISYLYMSDDIKTSIFEVRPHVNQNISVAEIRVDKNLEIYDFCSEKGTEDISEYFMLQKISELFSDTKQQAGNDYYATQYISEYIKKKGYDGIRYKSSLNPEGHNIVLFDTQIHSTTKKKNYTILNTKVYTVSGINLQYNQIAPQG